MRLDKYLAEAAIGKRKEVRNYVKEGKVRVNGQIELMPAAIIDENHDVIAYHGTKVEYTGKLYYMFHKPAGCITAKRDLNKKTVFDYLEKIDSKSLFPVGRLDKDTEGLLFITNDGTFNHRLMSPDNHVSKTYFFWAFGELTRDKIHRLENGILLEEGEALTKEAKLEIIKEGLLKDLKNEIEGNQYEKFKKNREIQPVVSGCITIFEGRKHQIKRMMKAVGCYVVYLKRISIGEVFLDQSLKRGEYRLLTEGEIQRLLKD